MLNFEAWNRQVLSILENRAELGVRHLGCELVYGRKNFHAVPPGALVYIPRTMPDSVSQFNIEYVRRYLTAEPLMIATNNAEQFHILNDEFALFDVSYDLEANYACGTKNEDLGLIVIHDVNIPIQDTSNDMLSAYAKAVVQRNVEFSRGHEMKYEHAEPPATPEVLFL